MKEKALGQYFTPDHVAEFMVGLRKGSSIKRVLEPCSGTGVFLRALESKKLKINIEALEIDSSLPNSSETRIRQESFICAEFNKSFDLVIGNPPYVRWKNLSTNQKKELLENDLWQQHCNTLCDYLYIFILKSVELLREGGELIFITPSYWLTTKNAQTLRNYLLNKGNIREIYHFAETPIFEGVASSIVIFRFQKGTNSQSEVKVYKHSSRTRITKTDLKSLKESSPDVVSPFKKDEAWYLASNSELRVARKVEKSCAKSSIKFLNQKEQPYSRLGDIAEIANGMVSGKDKVFQYDGPVTRNEAKVLISVVKAKHLTQFFHHGATNYIFFNQVAPDLAISDLKREFPNLYRHLRVHREVLNQRYQYNKAIPYWEWVFPRSYQLFSRPTQKIFIPCKERISHKEHVRFSLVEGGLFPTQDVTAIIPFPQVRESIYYILAFLSSRWVFAWLQQKGHLRGGVLEFSERPLSEIPIKRINWSDTREYKAHEKISQISRRAVEQKNQSLHEEIDQEIAKLLWENARLATA